MWIQKYIVGFYVKECLSMLSSKGFTFRSLTSSYIPSLAYNTVDHERKITYGRGCHKYQVNHPSPVTALVHCQKTPPIILIKRRKNSSPLDHVLLLLFCYNALVMHNYPEPFLEHAMLSNSWASTMRMERKCICKCQPTSSISPHSNNTHLRFSNWSYIFFLNVVVR